MEKEMKGIKRRISFTGLCIGLFFLWNPVVGLFDFFPDLIGFLFIFVSLRTLSATTYGFDEARRKFRNLIWVEIGRLALFVSVFMLSDVSEHANGILIVVFLYSVFDLLFTLPAFRALLNAFSLSGDRIGSEVMNRPKGKISAMEAIERRTVTFLILRAVLQIIPELSVLTLSSDEEHNKFLIFYEYINAFRVIFAIPIVIFGTIWLIQTVRFFAALSKDSAYRTGLEQKFYQNISEHPSFYSLRKTNICRALIWASVVFFFDFRMDGIDLLPDSVGIILIWTVILILSSLTVSEKKRQTLILAIIGISVSVFSVFGSILDISYYARYTERSIFFHEEAYYKYVRLNIITVIADVLTLCSFFVLFFLMRALYKKANDKGRELTAYETAEKKETIRYFVRIPVAAVLLCIGKIVYLAYFTVTESVTPILLIATVIAGFLYGFTFSEFVLTLQKVYEMKISSKNPG